MENLGCSIDTSLDREEMMGVGNDCLHEIVGTKIPERAVCHNHCKVPNIAKA